MEYLRRAVPVALAAALVLILTGCTTIALRNSEPEVGSLVVARAVDSHNKPIGKQDTFDSSVSQLFVSGRLAHQPDAELKVELLKDARVVKDARLTVKRTGRAYPDNYFSIEIDRPRSGWKSGLYTLRVYPADDPNPFKTQVSFQVICPT